MKKYGFWIVISAVMLFGGLYGVFGLKPYVLRGSVIDPPIPAPAFTLTDQNGSNFSLSDHYGKVVIMFFGYTYCPDVCPTALYEMKSIKKRLNSKEENVEFVFITVDPLRDTTDQLKRYLASYDESFWGLTSDENKLNEVWKKYGVFRQIQDEGKVSGYLVDHSARLYVINPKGELLMTYTSDASVDDIVSDIAYLIKQGK
jgi:protein SCO1/2